MIGGLIHFVLNTALVVVLAAIAAIVFVIAWPFWYIRRRLARARRPEIALEVLNQRYARGEIGRTEYLQNRDDILAAQASD
jgi:putative membrane protein